MSKSSYIVGGLIGAVVYFSVAAFNEAKGAEDVTVTCFTQEQIDNINNRIHVDKVTAYNTGHDDGMIQTFEAVRATIKQYCADPANAGAPVSFGQGVYLECPKAAQK